MDSWFESFKLNEDIKVVSVGNIQEALEEFYASNTSLNEIIHNNELFRYHGATLTHKPTGFQVQIFSNNSVEVITSCLAVKTKGSMGKYSITDENIRYLNLDPVEYIKDFSIYGYFDESTNISYDNTRRILALPYGDMKEIEECYNLIDTSSVVYIVPDSRLSVSSIQAMVEKEPKIILTTVSYTKTSAELKAEIDSLQSNGYNVVKISKYLKDGENLTDIGQELKNSIDKLQDCCDVLIDPTGRNNRVNDEVIAKDRFKILLKLCNKINEDNSREKIDYIVYEPEDYDSIFLKSTICYLGSVLQYALGIKFLTNEKIALNNVFDPFLETLKEFNKGNMFSPSEQLKRNANILKSCYDRSKVNYPLYYRNSNTKNFTRSILISARSKNPAYLFPLSNFLIMHKAEDRSIRYDMNPNGVKEPNMFGTPISNELERDCLITYPEKEAEAINLRKISVEKDFKGDFSGRLVAKHNKVKEFYESLPNNTSISFEDCEEQLRALCDVNSIYDAINDGDVVFYGEHNDESKAIIHDLILNPSIEEYDIVKKYLKRKLPSGDDLDIESNLRKIIGFGSPSEYDSIFDYSKWSVRFTIDNIQKDNFEYNVTNFCCNNYEKSSFYSSICGIIPQFLENEYNKKDLAFTKKNRYEFCTVRDLSVVGFPVEVDGEKYEELYIMYFPTELKTCWLEEQNSFSASNISGEIESSEDLFNSIYDWNNELSNTVDVELIWCDGIEGIPATQIDGFTVNDEYKEDIDTLITNFYSRSLMNKLEDKLPEESASLEDLLSAFEYFVYQNNLELDGNEETLFSRPTYCDFDTQNKLQKCLWYAVTHVSAIYCEPVDSGLTVMEYFYWDYYNVALYDKLDELAGLISVEANYKFAPIVNCFGGIMSHVHAPEFVKQSLANKSIVLLPLSAPGYHGLVSYLSDTYLK